MHELPITKTLFRTVERRAAREGARKVNRVVLEVGILRDFVPEIIQKYWDYIAKGALSEGAKIEVRELDASAECGRCGSVYMITKGHIADAHCPVCGYEGGKLLSGSELGIVGIEIER